MHPFRNKDFRYKSVELRDYDESHLCVVIKLLDKSKVLIRIEPPLPKEIYGLNEDMYQVVLSPRHKEFYLLGYWLQKSLRVNLCIPDDNGTLINGPWRILDIGDATLNT